MTPKPHVGQKKIRISYFSKMNSYVKFQDTSIYLSRVMKHTQKRDEQMNGRTSQNQSGDKGPFRSVPVNFLPVW